MVKKEKRIDNPLFENTEEKESSVAEAPVSRLKKTEKKETGKSKTKEKRPKAKAGSSARKSEKKKEDSKSLEDLMKIKEELKDRLSRIEKESEQISKLQNKFLFVNRFDDSTEIEEIDSDSDLVAEWGTADENKKESREDEKASNEEEGKGEIFQVINELEQDLYSRGVLNNSLELDLTETRKELNELRQENEELKKNVSSLEESTKLSEDLLEKLALAEEEKNRAQKRRQDIEAELEFIISEKRNLETSLYDARMKLKEIEKNNEDLQAEIKLLKEKNSLLEEIQNDLSYTIARKDKDLEKMAMLESELEAQTTARDALELDHRTAKKIIARIKEEKETVETRLSYLEEEKNVLESKLAASTEENRKSNERVQQLARELGSTRATKNNLESECNILKKTLENIHGALVKTKRKSAVKKDS